MGGYSLLTGGIIAEELWAIKIIYGVHMSLSISTGMENQFALSGLKIGVKRANYNDNYNDNNANNKESWA